MLAENMKRLDRESKKKDDKELYKKLLKFDNDNLVETFIRLYIERCE